MVTRKRFSTTNSPLRTTTLSSAVPIARIAVSGGFMIAVKCSSPRIRRPHLVGAATVNRGGRKKGGNGAERSDEPLGNRLSDLRERNVLETALAWCTRRGRRRAGLPPPGNPAPDVTADDSPAGSGA